MSGARKRSRRRINTAVSMISFHIIVYFSLNIGKTCTREFLKKNAQIEKLTRVCFPKLHSKPYYYLYILLTYKYMHVKTYMMTATHRRKHGTTLIIIMNTITRNVKPAPTPT